MLRRYVDSAMESQAKNALERILAGGIASPADAARALERRAARLDAMASEIAGWSTPGDPMAMLAIAGTTEAAKRARDLPLELSRAAALLRQAAGALTAR